MAQRQPSGDENELSKYGDHPLLGRDRKPFSEELMRSPGRDPQDPLEHRQPLPNEQPSNVQPIRPEPHDPRIDYQEPNPIFVVPVPNASLRLLSVVLAVILALLVAFLMFYNWMRPGPRQPGQGSPSRGIEQKLPG